jgi:hypothetical protein
VKVRGHKPKGKLGLGEGNAAQSEGQRSNPSTRARK